MAVDTSVESTPSHVREVTSILLFACIITAPVVIAQPGSHEEGRPYYVERFSPSDYGQHAQNWYVVQDDRGRVFVANRTAVLEFDGEQWRSHAIPNLFVRSLAVTSVGAVCVGGVGEIGCLHPDAEGTLRYESLLPTIPVGERGFTDVWTVQAVGDAVYFQTFSRVFRWDGETIASWSAVGRFHKAFAVRDRYFVRDDGAGLLEMRGNQLVLVPGSELFAEERIDAMLPAGTSDALLVTRTYGLLQWDGNRFTPRPSEVDALIAGERIYHGIGLTDSTYALGTVSGRVIIGHVDGFVQSILGTNVGLEPDELVLDLFQDHQGGLWLALDTGIMRVDTQPSLTLFDHAVGLEGLINDVVRIKGRIHVLTSQGLYYLEPAASVHDSARFMRTAGLRQQIWSVLDVQDAVLAAANDGIYEIAGGRERKIFAERAFAMRLSQHRSGRVFVGLKDGLGILVRDEMGWHLHRTIGEGEIGEVRSIHERADGEIWVGTLADGVFRILLHEGQGFSIDPLGPEFGIPGGNAAMRYRSGDYPLILRHDGVYSSSDGSHPRYDRDRQFDDVIDFAEDEAYLLSMPAPHRLWVISGGRLHAYVDEDGGFSDVTPTALRLTDVPARALYIDGIGEVWVAVQEGLLRYDPHVEKDYATSYPAFVRTVRQNGQEQVIFGGDTRGGFEAPTLQHAANNLRFEVAAATFNDRQATRFQYWLEGFDQGWSDWTRERFKEYTNLPEGRYHFHVRARNAHGVISEVDTFAFTILPPWYRAWWAYLLYGLGAVTVVWGYARWRLKEHVLEMERERRVREEVERANARLVEANARLHEADKLKDDLLANTSHELRTPLTSILGFSSVLAEDLTGENQDFAVHIHKSGQRLLRTVDSLLDMARLQADTMELEPVDLDVAAAVREVASTFADEAAEKGLFLTVLPQELVVEGRIDRVALDCILTNLIHNAVKFTEQGGVTLLIDADPDQIYLTVRDSGVGISEEFLPELFVPFKQASDGYARTHEGTGIGLAVTQRFVRMLGGEITVESEYGHGTTFHVRLPRWAEDQRESTDHSTGERLTEARLLLIVDAEQPHHSLRRALSEVADYEVATGLDEGLEALGDGSFNVVLVAERMGESGPSRRLVQLRNVRPDHSVAFVAVSARHHSGQREHFLAAGYDEHLAGPFTRSRLLITLEPLTRDRAESAATLQPH